MIILILEDDAARHKLFRENLIGAVLDIVETVEEAKAKLLAAGPGHYDILMLDHDLGGKTHQPSGPGTGYELAQWLAENPTLKPESILLHSHNEPGRKNMQSVLPEAIETPGAWVFSSIQDGKLVYRQPYLLPQKH